MKTLKAFCCAVSEAGLGPETDSDTVRPGGATSSSSSSPQGLAPIIRSQVLQSGLIDSFAAAMSIAADSILTANDVTDVNDSTLQDGRDLGRAATTSQAVGVSHKPQANQPSLLRKRLMTSTHWLTTWTHVCHMWPEGRERLAFIAAAAPAAVRLAAAMLQVTSRDLPAAVQAESQRAQEGAAGGRFSDAAILNDCVKTVLQIVSWLACGFNGLGSSHLCMPELQPLLTMPEFITVFATMLVVTAEALLARQKLGPTAAANTSSATTSPGTTGRSSSSACRSTKAASSAPSTDSSSNHVSRASNKLNRKLESLLRNLPESTTTLLEILGMDSRAVVWAAAAQRDRATAGELDSNSIALAFVLCWQVAAVQTARLQAEEQQLQKLLLLVPAVLLHWAANSPDLTKQQDLKYVTQPLRALHD